MLNPLVEFILAIVGEFLALVAVAGILYIFVVVFMLIFSSEFRKEIKKDFINRRKD